LASLKTSLEYCKGLGVKKLHIMAGKRVDGVDKREAMEIFKNNLIKILPDLEKNGVTGLIEPINPWSVPNYNMDSFKDAISIIK